jgi:hypothetical protein
VSCTRSQETDLAGFVVEPSAAEWAEFRAHYPGCAACSAEVARWSKLEGALSATGTAWHPSDEMLLAFERAPAKLRPGEGSAIRRHLGSCVLCRDALTAVRSFDFGVAAVAEPSRVREQPAEPSWLSGLLASLGDALLSPKLSFALALAAAVLVIPAGYALWWLARTGSPVESIVVAEPLDAPEPESPALWVESPETEVALGATTGSEEPGDTEAPIAETEASASPDEAIASHQELDAAPEWPPAGEEILIAALMPASPLVYTPPSGSSPLPSIGGAVRGIADVAAAPIPLAPDHVAWASRGSPRLYWFAPKDTETRIDFTLVSPGSDDPILEFTMGSPVEAGIHAVDLHRHEVILEPGIPYEWYLSLVPDEERRSLDVVAGGAIELVEMTGDLRTRVANADPAELGRVFAANGLWYDALDFISEWIEKHPEEPALRSQRAALLGQVGLREAADYDRHAEEASSGE